LPSSTSPNSIREMIICVLPDLNDTRALLDYSV
jgi:hypothetical protein